MAKITKTTDYLERHIEFFDNGLNMGTCKIRYDFLKVMPLYKWQYCHEILSLDKEGYCDWDFDTFLHELEYHGTCSERILELDCVDKKHQKPKLKRLIKKMEKEASTSYTTKDERHMFKSWYGLK